MSRLGEPQAAVTLSQGQNDAIRIVESAGPGEFVLVTGKAGAGKSTISRRTNTRRTIVTAPSGLAAINVGGTTCHRAFRLPIGPLTVSKCHALDGEKARVIREADRIVIDEISMVRADVLDGINWALQKTMNSREPWGGKTVIAYGDNWQLEPVVSEGEQQWMQKTYRSPFWFDAKVFQESGNLLDDHKPSKITIAELTEVFRQKDGPFVDALNALRVGDPAGLFVFNQRSGLPMPIVEPVALTFSNKRAAMVNQTRINSLATDQYTYEADISGEFAAKDMPVDQDLVLKIGAQVMIARNLVDEEGGFVANGAIGEVAEFERDAVMVQLRDGREVRVQRQTWEKMGYTFDMDKDEITQEVEGTFTQIPLKLAWAITTHKSQGQTLDGAVLELEMPAFAHGQLYVAISRVKTLEGLYLRRKLSSRDIVVHSRIREWTNANGLDQSAPADMFDMEALT